MPDLLLPNERCIGQPLHLPCHLPTIRNQVTVNKLILNVIDPAKLVVLLIPTKGHTLPSLDWQPSYAYLKQPDIGINNKITKKDQEQKLLTYSDHQQNLVKLFKIFFFIGRK